MQCPTPRAQADPASPTHKQVRIARHIIVCMCMYVCMYYVRMYV